MSFHDDRCLIPGCHAPIHEHFWCDRDRRHLHAWCGHSDGKCERTK